MGKLHVVHLSSTDKTGLPDPRRLVSYSRLGRTKMATLTVQICVRRLKKLLSSLKITSLELLWRLLALTMHLGTRSEQMMHSRHDICPNFQSTGLGKMGSVRCAVECFQMENHRTYIFQRITQICQGSLRA